MNNEPRLLLISDNTALRAALQEGLTRHAPCRLAFAASAERLDALQDADLVIIDDAALGGIAAASLFESGSALPVLLIGRDTGEDDIIVNMRDIFPRPLRLGQLLARIRFHLEEKNYISERVSLPLGPYDFFADEYLLQTGQGRMIRLTEKERDILARLYEAGGETVERGQLLEDVWGYVQGLETHTLETHIYRLRQKIEADPVNPALLLTEEKGYRLDPAAPVPG